MDVKNIERHSFDETKNHRDILLQTPLVFRGAAKNWNAVKHWEQRIFQR